MKRNKHSNNNNNSNLFNIKKKINMFKKREIINKLIIDKFKYNLPYTNKRSEYIDSSLSIIDNKNNCNNNILLTDQSNTVLVTNSTNNNNNKSVLYFNPTHIVKEKLSMKDISNNSLYLKVLNDLNIKNEEIFKTTSINANNNAYNNNYKYTKCNSTNNVSKNIERNALDHKINIKEKECFNSQITKKYNNKINEINSNHKNKKSKMKINLNKKKHAFIADKIVSDYNRYLKCKGKIANNNSSILNNFDEDYYPKFNLNKYFNSEEEINSKINNIVNRNNNYKSKSKSIKKNKNKYYLKSILNKKENYTTNVSSINTNNIDIQNANNKFFDIKKNIAKYSLNNANYLNDIKKNLKDKTTKNIKQIDKSNNNDNLNSKNISIIDKHDLVSNHFPNIYRNTSEKNLDLENMKKTRKFDVKNLTKNNNSIDNKNIYSIKNISIDKKIKLTNLKYKEINRKSKNMLLKNKDLSLIAYQDKLLRLIKENISNEYLRNLAASFKDIADKSIIIDKNYNNNRLVKIKAPKSRWDNMLEKIGQYIPEYLCDKLKSMNTFKR